MGGRGRSRQIQCESAVDRETQTFKLVRDQDGTQGPHRGAVGSERWYGVGNGAGCEWGAAGCDVSQLGRWCGAVCAGST